MTIRKGLPDVRRELFGGQGEVRVWNLLRAAAEPFTAALSCELSPAGTVGRHVQAEFPEIIIGVEGNGAATVNDAVHPLCSGDVVHLPLGSVLSLENRSSEAPLRYLLVKARG